MHPGEVLGLVGRTGAGKSTLLLALSRMVSYSGCIKIDGVDVQRLPVHLLRSLLAVVPQTPILFSGTVRFNLDPAGVRTEAELFDALQLCRLDKVVRALPQVRSLSFFFLFLFPCIHPLYLEPMTLLLNSLLRVCVFFSFFFSFFLSFFFSPFLIIVTIVIIITIAVINSRTLCMQRLPWRLLGFSARLV